MLEKLIDLFMFREGTEEDDAGSSQPIITMGSIVWGLILRSSILVFLSFLLVNNLEYRRYWFVALFLIWFLALFPGWRQFQIYQKRIKKFSDETLCGSCKHFEETGQLCRILDEHPTQNNIPCEGMSWEPKTFEEDNGY